MGPAFRGRHRLECSYVFTNSKRFLGPSRTGIYARNDKVPFLASTWMFWPSRRRLKSYHVQSVGSGPNSTPDINKIASLQYELFWTRRWHFRKHNGQACAISRDLVRTTQPLVSRWKV